MFALIGRIPRTPIMEDQLMRCKVLAVALFLGTGLACLSSYTHYDALARNPIVNPAGSPQGFHRVAKYKLGGEGGWDYLTMDSATRRFYISRGNKVVVINIDNGSVVGEIPNTNGVHGIALATDVGKGFVSDGRDGKVTIFDLNTLKVTGEAKAGRNPDAIIYDDGTKRVFAFNGGSSDATAIDATTGEVAGTIPLEGKPEFGAADGKGTVFVNIENKNEVAVIDSKKLTVKARWPVAPGDEPSGLALDRTHRRLFIGCGGNNKMVIMNADNGKVVVALPIGAGVDACGYDPANGLAFASNGDGTLTVVHEDSPDKFTVVENAKTEPRARTMAVDEKTHNVVVVTAEFGATPAATAGQPRPRPQMVPDTFTVYVYGR
jgi:DNA-binding beta-propeller fold protein YncE